MFFSKLPSTRPSEAFSDLTITKDVGDWHTGVLRVLTYHFDVVVIAFDPIFGLLASGTSSGVIRVLGAPGCRCIARSTRTSAGILPSFFNIHTSARLYRRTRPATCLGPKSGWPSAAPTDDGFGLQRQV
ncbi:hypothetical protein EDD15DRAFT_2242815, partial [Pisolithus albus]